MRYVSTVGIFHTVDRGRPAPVWRNRKEAVLRTAVDSGDVHMKLHEALDVFVEMELSVQQRVESTQNVFCESNLLKHQC